MPLSDMQLGVSSSLGAMLLFCLMDAIIKHFVAGISPFQVMAFTYIGAALLCGLYAVFKLVDLMNVTSPRNVIIYGSLYLLEMIVFFYALQQLDFSLVFIFVMTIPIVAAKLANIFLHEPLSMRRHIALLLAFAGVLVTVFMESGNASLIEASLFGVVCALLDIVVCAAKIVFLRKYGGLENPQTLNFWALIIMAAGGVVLTLIEAQPVTVTADMLWLVIVPILTFFAGLLYVLSYRFAPASIIAPLMFTQLVWGTLIGVFFFGEDLTPAFLTGASVMCAAGLLFYWPEKRMALS